MFTAVKFYFTNVLEKNPNGNAVEEGLQSFLKGLKKVHDPKKASVFELADLEKFLIEAPNKGRFLQHKLMICVALAGGPRGEETTYLLIGDFDVKGEL